MPAEEATALAEVVQAEEEMGKADAEVVTVEEAALAATSLAE